MYIYLFILHFFTVIIETHLKHIWEYVCFRYKQCFGFLFHHLLCCFCSVLVWPLRISSTIPVSRTLSGCRALSYKHAWSGALLPSNGERPPCTQWRMAPLPSSERTGRRSGDQTSWGQRRKASTLGKTGSTDDAVQDGHVGWRLRTGVKKCAAVMGAEGYHLSSSDCDFS